MARLIVSGPPFSGSSIVGEALARSGVHLGDGVGTPTRTDAVGLFVNRAAARLHDDLLAINGVDWQEPTGALRVPAAYREDACALVAAQFGDRPAWALVEPRAVLFADLWREIVPDARWLFVVRRPPDWAWAILRRQSGRPRAKTPMRRLAAALRTWEAYGRRVLDCCTRDADRSRVLLVPDDCGPGIEAALENLITDGSGRMALDSGELFREELLGADPPPWVGRQVRWQRGANETFAALRRWRLAGSNGGPSASAAASPGGARQGGPRRVICLASRRKHGLSETFVRDHVRLLPGTVRWLNGGIGELKYETNDRPVGSLAERTLHATMSEFGFDRRGVVTRTLARYLRRMHVDVVLAEFGAIAVDYVDACRETGVPLVAHFHGYDAYRRSTLEEHGKEYRRLFDVARVVIAVSRDMVEQLVALGASREKIVWNPCGVDTDVFQGATPASAPPLFVSVGRFVEKKAPHNVLLAFHALAQRRPEARLVMVGEGVMRDMCRQLVDALGLADRVVFTGGLAPIEIARTLRGARAFVQHSVIDGEGNAEGTPVSILEAGASGLPVVATRHMGIKDVVVEGETGLLVDEGDVAAMSEHLLTLCDDRALAADLGRRAQERIRELFSMERSIARLSTALDTAIARGRA